MEPSERYGDSALKELTSLIRGPTVRAPPLTDGSDDPGKGGILSVGAALVVLLLLAVAVPIYSRIRRPQRPSDPAPRRRAWVFPWRLILVFVVVLLLGSIVAGGLMYLRSTRDAGVTPQYNGPQATRNPESVVIGAAGDISCRTPQEAARSGVLGTQ